MGGADALTLARLPLAAAVAMVSLMGGSDGRIAVIALACAAAATDIADGWWARRTGTESARGARLDSWADGALTVALAIALLALVPREAWSPWVLGSLVAVVALRVAVMAMRRRRGLPALDHTVPNRAAGAVAFVAVVVALATGETASWPTAVALVTAVIAALFDARTPAGGSG